MSNRIEKIYTSTEVCIPKGFNVCGETEKLWNSTFIKLENEVYRLVYNADEQFDEAEVDLTSMKCFKGEPDLEKLTAYGKVITLCQTLVLKLRFSQIFPQFHQTSRSAWRIKMKLATGFGRLGEWLLVHESKKFIQIW